MISKFFFSEKSFIEITTYQTVDEIKSILASNFIKTRYDPIWNIPLENLDDSKYFYYIKKLKIKIYFSENFRINNPFRPRGIYPYFSGRIIDNGRERIIKGKIIIRPFIYVFLILFFIPCLYFYTRWLLNGMNTVYHPGWAYNTYISAYNY